MPHNFIGDKPLVFFLLELASAVKAGLTKSSEIESVRSIILITAVERVLKVLADSIDAVLEFLDS